MSERGGRCCAGRGRGRGRAVSPAETALSRELHGRGTGCTRTTGCRRPAVPPIHPSRVFHPVPSRPIPPMPPCPPRGAAGAAALLTKPAPAAGGAAEETLGAGSAETPQFIPPEGQRRPGPRRAGTATFSLFGRLRATERPRSHEWSRASPGAAPGPPGPCKAGAGQRGPCRRMAK